MEKNGWRGNIFTTIHITKLIQLSDEKKTFNSWDWIWPGHVIYICHPNFWYGRKNNSNSCFVHILELYFRFYFLHHEIKIFTLLWKKTTNVKEYAYLRQHRQCKCGGANKTKPIIVKFSLQLLFHSNLLALRNSTHI